MAKTKGLAPSRRKLATTAPTHTKAKKLTANQWQNTPQQHLFMDKWISPDSNTFGNAYESAIAAHYSTHYAMQLTSPSILNKWITEYTRKLDFGPEHIKQGIQKLAIRANDSRSPDDTRLKAYETLARIMGMIDKNNSVTVVNVQPILGGASVTKVDNTIIDQ